MSGPQDTPRKQAAPGGDDLATTRLRLWLHMLKTTRHVEAEIRDRLRRHYDTTLPRFDVMAALYRSPQGLKMSALSRELMVSNGNVTGIVDRLVSEGLVMRVALQGDRRASLARLTAKGRELFAEMAAAHRAWVNELLGACDGADAERMIEKLARLRNRP